MRVAIVMPLAERRGGAEALLVQLMRIGGDRDIEWSVVFLEHGSMVHELEALGVECSVVAAGRVRHARRYVRSVFEIRALARRRRADLILSWMTKAHLYGGPAATLARVPAVWYQHGLPAGGSALDRIATALPARGVIVTSAAVGAAQARLRPARAQRVVHPGIDLERFDPRRLPAPEQVRAALGLPTGGPLVGFCGRLQRWKGPHVLVDAMPAVLEAVPGAHCVIVGGRHELEPDYPDYLRRLIADRGLDQHVLLAGFRPDVPRWLHAMDVVALPSHDEPFGLALVEAMAMGKAVVAGDSGGPREIVTSGVDGVLVAEEDASALAGAVVNCLREPGLAARLGAAARTRAQHFSAERHARELGHAVRELAGG
jgi:glycosyltransferase involved in cell wall biosynthesis